MRIELNKNIILRMNVNNLNLIRCNMMWSKVKLNQLKPSQVK